MQVIAQVVSLSIVRTMVLTAVLVARLKEHGVGGLEWLIPFEAVLLYGISNAVGNLSANLSYRLAVEHGWGNPGMFPLLGRIAAGLLLAIPVSIANYWLLSRPRSRM